jgi:PDZ domain-containing protein
MHEEARIEWTRLVPPESAPTVSSEQWLGPRPGRRLSLGEAAAVLMKVPAPYHAPPQVVTPAHRWRWSLGAAVVAVALAITTLVAYHPPRAVITPGRPVDVSVDIQIIGVPVHHPTGRFLLLTVHVRRPNLVGLLTAMIRGKRTAAIDPVASFTPGPQTATQLGRQQYLDSQRVAIAAALAAAGVPGHRAEVVIRDRGFVGPSAGLVYALAVTDMLTGDGLTHGRVVAATGSLEPDGTVDPVGWVGVKAAEAAAGHATILLVPPGQKDGGSRSVPTVYEVKTLRQAVDILEKA